MVLKKTRGKIYEIRVYIGYGKSGGEKYAAIMKDAKAEGLKISEYVKEALRSRYPTLPL